MLRKSLLVLLILGFSVGLLAKSEIYIDTKIKPSSKFEEAKLKSVAILNFDANQLQTLGGKAVNYLALSKMFSDDLIKKLYTLGKLDVALGEYPATIVESSTVSKKKGDLYVDSSSIERKVSYDCVPYKKIQGVLSGSINKYRRVGNGKGKSFIDITLKLTDNYDGTVYWVTDMKGFYDNVIHTIAYTLNSGKYEEPVEAVEGESKNSKKSKKEEKNDSKSNKPALEEGK